MRIQQAGSVQDGETSPDVKIPLNSFVHVTAGLKVLAVFLLLLQRCWIPLTVTAIVFTAIYWILGGFFASLVLLSSVSSILYHAEDALLYHPNTPRHSREKIPIPSSLGMPYESFNIRSSDGTLLHLFLMRQPEPIGAAAPTILFLHGNAGNIGHWLPNMHGFFCLLKFNLLMLEYRGYGLSEGRPSELGLYADAKSALDYLLSRGDIDHSKIIVFGRSLGGAVAVDLAAHPDCSSKLWCVILENTFTSIPDMANILLGNFMRFIPLFFYKNKFMSCDKVRHITAPALFISGLSDELVPSTMMTNLFTACGASLKRCVVFTDGTHNETWRCDGYFLAVNAFLEEVCSKAEDFNNQTTVRIQPLKHSSIKSV